MKRLCAAVLCASLIVLSQAAVSANSGPSHWETSPSFSVTPLSDCPITVTEEDLSFDFAGQEHSGFSPLATVTAQYRMKNPTAEARNVQMAFPLIASLSDLPRLGKIQIQADGKDLPFRISVGGEKPRGGVSDYYFTEEGELQKTNLPSFQEILRSVSAPPAAPEALSGQGTLYRFRCAGNFHLKADLQALGENAALLTTGVSGFSQTGSGIHLTGWSDAKSGEMSVLVFGDVSKPEVAAYQDGECRQKADDDVNVTEEKQDAGSFLREKLKQTEVYQAYPTEDFLSALTSAALRAAGNSLVAFGDGELYGFLDQQRILVLTYEVPFPANGTRRVSVRYPMSGAMNSEKTASPVYSYGYLLSPAKSWAGFQNLSIRVIPPQKAPYLVKSSIPMTRSQDGSYSAKLGSLPDGDLTFSLYPSEKLTPKPAFSHIDYGLLLTLVLVGILLLLFLLFLHLFSFRRAGS
ncbi:hypothetical protein A7X67_01375 [Clostridium sp. W14A]|nr:hypothetical protein A7X67_01375 [Clostridium sp. W14A]